MKKILLLAALAAGAVSAQAQMPAFTDIFKIESCHVVNGERIPLETLEDGQTIVSPYYFDPLYKDFPGMLLMGYTEEYPLLCTNISDEPWRLDYDIRWVAPELPVNEDLGFCQGCYFLPSGMGSCIGCTHGQTASTKPFGDRDYPAIDPEDALFINLEISNVKDLTPKKIEVKFFVEEGEEEATFTLYVEFTNTTDISAAVDAIGSDSAAAEYFNLQGVRVANPEHGLFIKKQGGKASKVIL